ncbi:FluC/FEX family fluoride channel [Jatrophihabitans fulvus]
MTRPVHRRPAAIGLVFAGGAVGTAVRQGFEALAPATSGRWPVGTFVANVVGALVLGALLEALTRSGDDSGRRRRARLLVGTGFCGGLTTYSTFAVESDLLVRDGHGGLAAAYLVATVVTGIVVAVLGIAAAAAVHRRRSA